MDDWACGGRNLPPHGGVVRRGTRFAADGRRYLSNGLSVVGWPSVSNVRRGGWSVAVECAWVRPTESGHGADSAGMPSGDSLRAIGLLPALLRRGTDGVLGRPNWQVRRC